MGSPGVAERRSASLSAKSRSVMFGTPKSVWLAPPGASALSKGIVGATTTYPADAHRLSKLAY